jgi:hypothetical protein
VQHLKEVTETYSQKDSHLNVVVVTEREEYKQVIVVGMVSGGLRDLLPPKFTG